MKTDLELCLELDQPTFMVVSYGHSLTEHRNIVDKPC